MAAIVIEPMQGEGGFQAAPVELMLELRRICDAHGILLIADEVQSGFARTGKLFAIEHYPVKPDLITVAKSLAGGFPLAGVIGRAEVMDAPAPGGLGGTYGGNPVACAAALGGATAELFAQQGAKVALFDLNDELGSSHAKAIGGLYCRVNVSDDDSVNSGIEAAVAAHGVPRVLVNCAGIGTAGKTVGRGQPHDMDLFRRTIEVNLIGTFNVLSKVAARMVAAEPIGEQRGVIINTASCAAFDGQIG